MYGRNLFTGRSFKRQSSLKGRFYIKSAVQQPDGDIVVHTSKDVVVLDQKFNEKFVKNFREVSGSPTETAPLFSDVFDGYSLVAWAGVTPGVYLTPLQKGGNTVSFPFSFSYSDFTPQLLLASGGKLLFLEGEKKSLTIYNSKGIIVKSLALTKLEAESGHLLRVGHNKFMIHVPGAKIRVLEISP